MIKYRLYITLRCRIKDNDLFSNIFCRKAGETAGNIDIECKGVRGTAEVLIAINPSTSGVKPRPRFDIKLFLKVAILTVRLPIKVTESPVLAASRLSINTEDDPRLSYGD
ncbi:hypothetical protein STW0522KLE44_17020 [Klebsiella sp. STW0522-44]|nr:hypothetical protein STW0522KLE44_17020 [Klebsiella sp. STW0522-44]